MTQGKKPKTFNEDATLRGAWRRVFARSPIVREVLAEGRRTVPRFNKDGSRHKVDSVQYQCQVCKTWTPAKAVSVDHVIPVIDVENVSGKVQDWNEFKRRLFCEKKNLQRICDSCHNFKTQNERGQRQAFKDQVALSNLEINIRSVFTIDELKVLKKQVAKYLTKKKAPEIKERATKLKEILIDKLTRED
jgi:5-methylcytosine-specific restriction endonuclease McrA